MKGDSYVAETQEVVGLHALGRSYGVCSRGDCHGGRIPSREWRRDFRDNLFRRAHSRPVLRPVLGVSEALGFGRSHSRSSGFRRRVLRFSAWHRAYPYRCFNDRGSPAAVSWGGLLKEAARYVILRREKAAL